MLRAENKQRKWRGWGGQEAGGKAEWRDGQQEKKMQMLAALRDLWVIYMTWQQLRRKPLSFPSSHLSFFICLPLS